ncbi:MULTISPECIES: hypothetical protein [spotted fever group]|uniref:Uncharacterized protein n=1 Tax=Rickettsia rhipicephali str. Ect TaxID=1359199 RepID=A0A0F3PFP5_RICRH|nr:MULTISPECIES: hypothetical protein [spotted fever group]KJV79185.1 hypothetical protein RMAECT_0635 [Rickettsia rhipicephali str. Ect]
MQIEINAQEYKKYKLLNLLNHHFFDINDDLVIYTKDLNEEIACSVFSVTRVSY